MENFVNNKMKINKEDKIIIFRSAFIGDFLVCLPFFDYLINDIGVSKENIYFITINNKNLNPLKFIFREESVLSLHSMVIDSYNTKSIIKSAINIKILLKDINISKTIYLSFLNESLMSKIKKMILIKYIVGIKQKIYGIEFNKNKVNYSQYLSYFDSIGVVYKKKKIELDSLLNFTNEEHLKVKNIYENNTNINIALYINSKLKMKIWPKENFLEIISYIKKKYNANIYLIGDSNDFNYNKIFINTYNINGVKNIAGQLSIRETFLFFNKIDLLVANDGAPIHMASYTNCSILGLYTYKEPIGSWAPNLSESYVIYRKNVACKECYLSECEDPICLTNIKASDIQYSIDLLIKKIIIKQEIILS